MAKFEKKDYFSTLVTLLMSCFLELTNAFNRTIAGIEITIKLRLLQSVSGCQSYPSWNYEFILALITF